MILTFFEPAHSEDTHIERNSAHFKILTAFELTILACFFIDMILRIHYTVTGSYKNKNLSLFKDKTFSMIMLCDLLMYIDAILFYSLYPSPYFRFGRLFRPIKASLESRHLSRTIYSILKTIPQIIDVALMLFFITLLYALFGNRFLDPNTPGLTVYFKYFIMQYSERVTSQP